jgi:hypothetical protein
VPETIGFSALAAEPAWKMGSWEVMLVYNMPEGVGGMQPDSLSQFEVCCRNGD